jgi:hypothetical protein
MIFHAEVAEEAQKKLEFKTLALLRDLRVRFRRIRP